MAKAGPWGVGEIALGKTREGIRGPERKIYMRYPESFGLEPLTVGKTLRQNGKSIALFTVDQATGEVAVREQWLVWTTALKQRELADLARCGIHLDQKEVDTAFTRQAYDPRTMQPTYREFQALVTIRLAPDATEDQALGYLRDCLDETVLQDVKLSSQIL